MRMYRQMSKVTRGDWIRNEYVTRRNDIVSIKDKTTKNKLRWLEYFKRKNFETVRMVLKMNVEREELICIGTTLGKYNCIKS